MAENAQKAEKKVIITRKIPIYFNTRSQQQGMTAEESKAQIKQLYDRLYKIQYAAYTCANWISAHHYVMTYLQDFHYLTEDVKIKLTKSYDSLTIKDMKKINDIENADQRAKKEQNHKEGILTTSLQNTTYQMIAKKYKGDIPSSILTSVNSQVTSVFSQEKTKYWKGEASLRTYKRTMPIPIRVSDMLDIKLEENNNYSFTLYKFPFVTGFGADRSGNRIIFERSLKGEYKLCDSSIMIKGNKMFLLAVFQFDKEKFAVDPDMVLEASLSVDTPIIAAIGDRTVDIGGKNEFLHRRIAIQESLRRSQKASRFNVGGKGRIKKMRSVDHFHDMEKNYIHTRQHQYTFKLIQIALENKCGKILLKDQTVKEQEAKQEEFLLRNWSYYGLRQMIEYKANKVGIEVVVE